MNKEQQIKAVLAESRNGMNQAIRYSPLFPRFIISDGVQELVEAAGCYWLLDILASELEPKLLEAINEGEVATVLVHLRVSTDDKATITATYDDDAPPFWTRAIDYTDFPAGDWVLFEVGALDWDTTTERANNIIAILLSEH